MTKGQPYKVPPGPRVNPLSFLSSLLLGSPPDLLGLYTGAARDYGDVVRFPGGPLTSYFFNHPDYIKHVLQDNNHNIPARALVILSPYVTQRRLDVWENPEGFDPGRFTLEQTVNRPRYAYFPFGGGPRQCIGNEFALMEATLVLATVARQYRLHLVPGHPVEPYPIFTLRPRHGVLMTLHPVS